MSTPFNGRLLLAGDIGGTKTGLAIFSEERGPRVPVMEAEFPSAAYPSLQAMVREFLAGTAHPVDSACFGVAGPVIRGSAKVTNLPWVIDTEELRRELNFRSVYLLNDLEAIAFAVPSLRAEDLHTLAKGDAVSGGAIAIIAPGTGLGQAFLTWDGSSYVAHPSEGGHADFAPNDAIAIGLLQYMRQRFDHVSCELVCSGIGIPNIYAYLRETGFAPESSEVARELSAAPDPNPVLTRAALDPTAPCKLCRAALDLFVSLLGAEAGNLALKVLATGGVYLAGGIPRRILPLIDNGTFLRAFRHKGRFSDLLARIPVHVVVRSAALMGVARYGLEIVALGLSQKRAM